MSTRSSPGSSAAERARAFDPVAGPATRVLILGSLPGAASLRAGRYYAHPRNLFWSLVGGATGLDLAALPYPARLAALQRSGIGLWDVIASAERRGSLDAAIRAPAPADLAALVGRLPALRAVAFNGRTAARLGRRALGATPLALVDLPSSSPAYAAMPIAAKRDAWAALAAFLG
jgi:hypoxanthine-DNA glycosylase